MFPSPSAEQSAIAEQLAAELLAYREGLRQLLHRQWDPELYRELSERFDRMQMQASALPRLSMTWTEVLISRAELMHALWNLRTPTRINGRVQALHAQHEQLVDELLAKCGRYTSVPEARAAHLAAPTDPAD
jgi:DNA-binding GntR family transcriptional regulator